MNRLGGDIYVVGRAPSWSADNSDGGGPDSAGRSARSGRASARTRATPPPTAARRPAAARWNSTSPRAATASPASPHPKCRPAAERLTGVSSGIFPISNDSFYSGSSTSAGLRFSGTFNGTPAGSGSPLPAPRRLSQLHERRGELDGDALLFHRRTRRPPRPRSSPAPRATPIPTRRHSSSAPTRADRSSSASSTARHGARASSPKTYKNLKAGKHTFKVRARDKAGNTDQSPAKRSWHVENQG